MSSVPRDATQAAPQSPSRAGFNTSFFLVLDDFGDLGRAYREAKERETDLETVITNMIEGQYERPVRVVEFNTAEGWSRDVSEDVAREVAARAKQASLELPRGTNLFVESELGDRFAGAD